MWFSKRKICSEWIKVIWIFSFGFSSFLKVLYFMPYTYWLNTTWALISEPFLMFSPTTMPLLVKYCHVIPHSWGQFSWHFLQQTFLIFSFHSVGTNISHMYIWKYSNLYLYFASTFENRWSIIYLPFNLGIRILQNWKNFSSHFSASHSVMHLINSQEIFSAVSDIYYKPLHILCLLTGICSHAENSNLFVFLKTLCRTYIFNYDFLN